MDVWNILQDALDDGIPVKISFEKNEMIIGKRKIISNGVSEYGFKIPSDDTPIETIEMLYSNYLTSMPSERSERKRKKYFYAKPFTELTDEELCFGEQRDQAMGLLEGWILIAKLNGSLIWQDDSKWFWKSNRYPSLVLLKKWIKGE